MHYGAARQPQAGCQPKAPATIQRTLRWIVALLASGFLHHSLAANQSDSIDAIAVDFVRAGLLFQNHDPLPYIYLGEPSWRQTAKADPRDLAATLTSLAQLQTRLAELPPAAAPLEQRRRRDLAARLTALQTRGEILRGNFPADFDQESRQLFGVAAPHYSEAHFRQLAAQLDVLIGGEGALVERIGAFRDRFIIPPAKLEAVIGRAMAECRARTAVQVALPANESVTLNLNPNMPWVGFTEYRGDSQSIVHLNNGVPVHIERAIELGCHEGYPGHHVHATLVEAELINRRGWVEYVYIPMVGPLAVIAEGAASYAMNLAFSREQRMQFEREVLLPLAGLSAEGLEDYYHYVDLIEQLNYARNEVARKYLYQGMSRADAVAWLVEFGLETPDTAETRLKVIDAQRSYVVTYNHGRQIVADHIAAKAPTDRNQAWASFLEILTGPLSPQDLQ